MYRTYTYICVCACVCVCVYVCMCVCVCNKVNIWERQKGNTKNMIWDVAHLLAYISTIMTLEPYDLVLTGG